MAGKSANLLRWIARIIALIWAGFWTFFGVASGLGERLDPAGVFMHTLLPGLVFLGSAFIPWRWQLWGGIVLILEGLAILIGYPIWAHGRFELNTIIFMLLTMALPPLISGIFFVFVSRKREPATVPTSP